MRSVLFSWRVLSSWSSLPSLTIHTNLSSSIPSYFLPLMMKSSTFWISYGSRISAILTRFVLYFSLFFWERPFQIRAHLFCLMYQSSFPRRTLERVLHARFDVSAEIFTLPHSFNGAAGWTFSRDFCKGRNLYLSTISAIRWNFSVLCSMYCHVTSGIWSFSFFLTTNFPCSYHSVFFDFFSVMNYTCFYYVRCITWPR